MAHLIEIRDMYKIYAAGAEPVLYATWAYQKGGKELAAFGMDYDEMFRKMYDAYHEAAALNRARIADVGKAFYELAGSRDLYHPDGSHPNEAGSRLAAEIIAGALRE